MHRRNLLKKSLLAFVTTSIALLLALSAFSATAAQAEESVNLNYLLGRPMTQQEKDEQAALSVHESLPLGEEIQLDDSAQSDATSSLYACVVLPTRYDLRAQIGGYETVSSVKNQDLYGACWAFSSLASAESSLLSRGIASNLSEAQLYHFAFSQPEIVPKGLEGDRTTTSTPTPPTPSA